jgi:hypothetical protein
MGWGNGDLERKKTDEMPLEGKVEAFVDLMNFKGTGS